MDAEPQTPESWVASILPPKVPNLPILKHCLDQHHKDSLINLEPISRALTGDIPFGGRSKNWHYRVYALDVETDARKEIRYADDHNAQTDIPSVS
jgi:hypothetical protein